MKLLWVLLIVSLFIPVQSKIFLNSFHNLCNIIIPNVVNNAYLLFSHQLSLVWVELFVQ